MSKKVRYQGQTYAVEDQATVADVKQELGIQRDDILMDDQGRELRDDQRAGDVFEKEETGVMPLVRTRYG